MRNLAKSAYFTAFFFFFFAFSASLKIFANDAENSNEATLLNVIKTEAAQMEIFPIAIVCPTGINNEYRWETWNFYYDLTFERFLPFHRFKTKACAASVDEIDECVAQFDSLSPKEQTLVLTAIYIVREAAPAAKSFHNRLLQDESSPTPYFPYVRWGNLEIKQGRRVLFFPPNVRSLTVDDKTSRRWNEVVERARRSDEIAFPLTTPYEPFTQPLAPQVKQAWYDSARKQLAEVNDRFGTSISEKEWTRPIELLPLLPSLNKTDAVLNPQASEQIDKFLQAVDALEKKGDSEETRYAVALREYYFTWQALQGLDGRALHVASNKTITVGDVAASLFQSKRVVSQGASGEETTSGKE